MTKKDLKEQITKMVEKEFETSVEWTKEDVENLDYFYKIFGKNVELKPENLSIVFEKSGYLTEVSVEDWNIIDVIPIVKLKK